MAYFSVLFVTFLIAGINLPKYLDAEGPRKEDQFRSPKHQREKRNEEVKVQTAETTSNGGPSNDDQTLIPRECSWERFKSKVGLRSMTKSAETTHDTTRSKKADREPTTTNWRQRKLTSRQRGVSMPSNQVSSNPNQVPFNPVALINCILKAVSASLSSLFSVVGKGAGAVKKGLATGISRIGSSFKRAPEEVAPPPPPPTTRKEGWKMFSMKTKDAAITPAVASEPEKTGFFKKRSTKKAPVQPEPPKNSAKPKGFLWKKSSQVNPHPDKKTTRVKSHLKSKSKKEAPQPDVEAGNNSVDLNVVKAFVDAATPCFELFELDRNGNLVLGPGYAVAAEAVKLQPFGAIALGATEAIVENVRVVRNELGEPVYTVNYAGLGARLGTTVLEATKFGYVLKAGRLASTITGRAKPQA